MVVMVSHKASNGVSPSKTTMASNAAGEHEQEREQADQSHPQLHRPDQAVMLLTSAEQAPQEEEHKCHHRGA